MLAAAAAEAADRESHSLQDAYRQFSSFDLHIVEWKLVTNPAAGNTLTT